MPKNTETIEQNVVVLHGIQLDRLTVYGPRGGKRHYWRSAWARGHRGLWYWRRIEAARVAPGYLGPNAPWPRPDRAFRCTFGPSS